MEMALQEEMPTYSGGLGVLAGDFLRSATSQHLPIVAVTLLHRKGYFFQKLDSSGWQKEEEQSWPVEKYLTELASRASVTIEGREVVIRAWRYDLQENKDTTPIFFLDTDLPENHVKDRTLTDYLYGGDWYYRLCQEIILGIGGVRMLRSIGYTHIERYHLNEGHASLLTLELLDESAAAHGRKKIADEDVEAVKRLCIFTTHTPVESGHDRFSIEEVNRALGRPELFEMKNLFCCENLLNMTFLGFNLSHYINGVAKKHGRFTQTLFANYTIESITNGVHPLQWTSTPIQQLFDKYIPGWREDYFSLRGALTIPKQELWKAHLLAKAQLREWIRNQLHQEIDLDTFTIGFGRRATAYKRIDLIFHDPEYLKEIAKRHGPIQIICGSKAHPHDQEGKKLIQKIINAKETLSNSIKVIFLENYDLKIAKLMTTGVDLWLSTPEPPLEASGTSGMKAALNGIPTLSVLDGWWVEGWIEGITGWAIGVSSEAKVQSNASYDARSLYEKLEKIVPMFYQKREAYLEIMLHAIALNGSFFTTQRMVLQYVLNAYFP